MESHAEEGASYALIAHRREGGFNLCELASTATRVGCPTAASSEKSKLKENDVTSFRWRSAELQAGKTTSVGCGIN